jgi:hypothetical protein
MIAALVFLLAGFFAILAGAVWLLGRPLPEESAQGRNKIEDLHPSHAKHLPQLRQSLASADTRYMRQKTPQEIGNVWRDDRRKVLRSFLSGVAQDYARLERLASEVDSLSARASKRAGFRKALFRVRFRTSYRVLSVEIAARRRCSMGRLTRLTDLVANLSADTETAMERLHMGPATRGPVNSPLNS